MYVIETENLVKKYSPPKGLRALILKSPLRKEITAVKNISLQVKKGEVFGFLGPNGAGKTTLIKMLSTLLRPTSGRAIVNGYDVISQENEAKNSIGLVTGEERSFYWRLTGRQNLQFFTTLYGLNAEEAKKRINDIFKQLELEDAAENMFYCYSSGMKQKLSFARGLISNPRVLFLDEPTKSVDVATGRALKSFIRKNLVEKEERTVFLTTHRLEEAEALCDRLAIINHGRIRFCGTIKELRNKILLKDRFNLSIKGISKNRLQKLLTHPGIGGFSVESFAGEIVQISFTVESGHNPLSNIIRSVLEDEATLISINKIEPKLEDLYSDFLNNFNGEALEDKAPIKGEKTDVAS